MEPLSLDCPYCGELVELIVDPSGGPRQHYVEDCPVCCRPWEVLVLETPRSEWVAELRTTDD